MTASCCASSACRWAFSYMSAGPADRYVARLLKKIAPVHDLDLHDANSFKLSIVVATVGDVELRGCS